MSLAFLAMMVTFSVISVVVIKYFWDRPEPESLQTHITVEENVKVENIDAPQKE